MTTDAVAAVATAPPPPAAAPAPAPRYAAALAALGPQAAPGAALDVFLGVMAAEGTTLYPAQEEALLELAEGKHVVLATPTGSGKSLVAEFHHLLSLSQGRRAYYTCPIKALVSEKFFALCRAFGPANVGMLTGDASVNRDAPILCCTAEILANMSLGDDADAIDDVVMDEFHYYGDAARGTAWQLPLLACRNATFLLMSATLGDVTAISQALTRDTGRPVALVSGHARPVPLHFRYQEVPLTETLAELASRGHTPAYVVHFSQREAIEAAQSATSSDFLSKEEKARLKAELGGFRFDTPFGKTMRRFVSVGIGVHHAGLLPKYRLLVEKLAQMGLLRVIMGTDTLGVGINVPIRSVVFTRLCKFDGEKVGILPVRDFRQIAGRAGRKGYDDAGDVLAQAPEHVIENKRMASRVEGDAKKLRKLVKKKPPAKGYVPYDEATFLRLQQDPPEPLTPRFALDQHLLLTVLQRHRLGYRQLTTLIGRSHGRPRDKTQLRRRARQLFLALRQAKIVSVVRAHKRVRAPRVVVNENLGQDFSLTHALTLFLLDTLPHLDAAAPDYALNVLSCVESILDNPDAVLRKQADRARTERMDELRAEGMDFEDRLAELDKVTYPKPLSDFLWPHFDAWQAKHAWAQGAHVRPKSVARELVEHCATFAEYVREYGLERQEGVLLRYLSGVVRALQQNLPQALVEDTLLDVLAYLRTMLGQVDASLVEAWSALVAPTDATTDAATDAARGTPPQPSARALWATQPRVLLARLRSEVHRLLMACARGDFVAAAAALATADANDADNPDADGAAQPPATAPATQALAEQLAPLLAEHAALDASPAARRPHFTRVTALGPDRLRVEQTLLADGEPTPYALCCEVALSDGPLPDGPLLQFVEVRT